MIDYKLGFLCFLILIFSSCQNNKQNPKEIPKAVIDLQGHRGTRGLMPENTIPAFLKALDYDKVTTLELDLAVTKNKKLVVSHEPWFNHLICTDSLGEAITEENKTSVYQLTYEQIAKYDCGSLGNPRFPEQMKQATVKPLLSAVIKEVEKKLDQKGKASINYNIEIKSLPEGDNIYHPIPAEFSDIVYKFISEEMNLNQVTIQSFDFRVLKYFHKTYPKVRLVALIENNKAVADNLTELGFSPEVYSPYYPTLTKARIQELHDKEIKVIPWTVNDTTQMKKLIDWEIDGIISDYPNLAQKILE